jgi:DNA polymerase-1
VLRTSGGPRRAGLDALVQHYLGIDLPKDEQKSDFSGKLSESQIKYAADDAAVLLPLREKMIAHIRENDLVETARIEFACAYAVADMEYNGIYLDTGQWTELTKEVETLQKESLEELYPFTGYPTVQMGFFGEEVHQELNLDSNKQVLELLRRNNIKVENTSKHELMQHSDEPIVQAIFKYRHASKALTSFLYSLPKQINGKTGRLHSHYMQNGAWSGRMSCSEPNIQQIPREKEFRSCFTAPEGRRMIIADYSQIELRVIAQISKDERMIEAYRAGEDLHMLTAALISGKNMDDVTKDERQAAKAVNFGLVFGMGGAGLQAYAADVYGVNLTLEEANLFRMRFFRGYKGVEAWHKYIKTTLPSFSRTLAGRKHTYNESSGMSGRFNTPVQGSAADILKNALGMLHARLSGTDTLIVAAVHDEIVLECGGKDAEKHSQLLKETMEEAGAKYIKDLPIIAEACVAESWAEK